MKKKLIGLIQLQDCDNKIKRIVKIRDEGPVKIQKLEQELKVCQSKYQQEYYQLESLKKDRRAIEQDVQEIDNKIFKSQEKLNNIKSNKEYKAALKEVEVLNKEKISLEDKEIRIMESLEGSEEKDIQFKEEQEKLKKKFELDKKEIEEEMRALETELNTLEEKRKQYIDTVDKQLLSQYQFLADRKGGMAIGPVINGVCQLCNIGLPPQKFNELIKGDALHACPNCLRIIYWAEDEYFSKTL